MTETDGVSLVLIKPDAVGRGLTGVIIGHLEGLGLRLVGLKMTRMDKELACQHYAPHQGKPFFESLVSYITSGPVVVAIFSGERAVERVREAMGATDPIKAEPGTIRAQFGIDIERNAVHGSDSAESAWREIELFFTAKEIFVANS